MKDLFGFEIVEQVKPRSICGCYVSECRCGKQAAIERHYLAGKSLTVLDALKLYKTVDLRKFNCQLRKKGLNIVGAWVFEPHVKFKVYKLIK